MRQVPLSRTEASENAIQLSPNVLSQQEFISAEENEDHQQGDRAYLLEILTKDLFPSDSFVNEGQHSVMEHYVENYLKESGQVIFVMCLNSNGKGSDRKVGAKQHVTQVASQSQPSILAGILQVLQATSQHPLLSYISCWQLILLQQLPDRYETLFTVSS